MGKNACGNELAPGVMRRLPCYLNYLKGIPSGSGYISSATIASALGYGDVQVRKDLAQISGRGKPKMGYEIDNLIAALESTLGYTSYKSAVIVGAGKLGMALYGYDGFSEYGLEIVAAFDADEKITRDIIRGTIYPSSYFSEYCRKHRIDIGIITVPRSEAQKVCDEMVKCGIRAIWNFSPSILSAPDSVTVRNENMAESIAVLSRSLEEMPAGK